MVEKFKEILREIKKDKGHVTVFAIIKMDEITDKWSVILSAPWTETQNTTENFNYLRGLLLKYLSSDDFSTIARLGIFTNDEHLIQLILKAIAVQDGEVNLKDTTLNGYKIHEAYIFESHLQ